MSGYGGGIILLVVLFVLICLAIIDSEMDCEAKGGHMVNAKGSSLCISPDGRILE